MSMYADVQRDAPNLVVPESIILECACATRGRHASPNWTTLFKFCEQLDRQDIPQDLRVLLRRFTNTVLDMASKGAFFLGPDSYVTDMFGTLGLLERVTIPSDDWEDVPFDSMVVGRIISTLEEFARESPDLFNLYGKEFREWLVENRQTKSGANPKG